jgi:hypothetical protein
LLEDLLWSDPESDLLSGGVLPNVRRNAGVLFGLEACTAFCDRMGVDFMIRSHEVRVDWNMQNVVQRYGLRQGLTDR